ncbi:MAG: PRC-barrel protein [Candidatus Sulfotelmatobacter sp.]|nr:PRC-barrel protein [Candidatus Sulfotelmatobacter sp.]
MAHCGSLNTQPVSDDVHDVRSSTVRGSDGEKLGTVNDVIFDHDTMEIRYLVVDSGGWLATGTFVLPADGVSIDESDDDGLAAKVTKQQIENSPQYNKNTLQSEDEWKKYEQAFKQYWEEEPVMHLKGSDRIITPPDQSPSTRASSPPASAARDGGVSTDREVNVADLFPNRISKVFSDTAPGSGKVTLRPKPVARAEEAASGVALLKPRWWESFENYLRLNKDDIRADCVQCKPKAA